jgi:hypothetical protein
MHVDDLERRLKRKPFEPFRVGLTDGQSFDVRHPELMMLGKRTAIIGVAAVPDDTHFDRAIDVDLFHIVSVEPIPANTPPAA